MMIMSNRYGLVIKFKQLVYIELNQERYNHQNLVYIDYLIHIQMLYHLLFYNKNQIIYHQGISSLLKKKDNSFIRCHRKKVLLMILQVVSHLLYLDMMILKKGYWDSFLAGLKRIIMVILDQISIYVYLVIHQQLNHSFYNKLIRYRQEVYILMAGVQVKQV